MILFPLTYVILAILMLVEQSISTPRSQHGQCPLLIPKNVSTRSVLTKDRRPAFITIAHRGASFSLPEHTIAAYRLALELGADYIEPDLVATLDERLVAIHSVDLNITTNVREVYPDRYGQIMTEDGKVQHGYFAFNFTLEEIKVLRVKQRLDGRSTQFDGMFAVPTLHEIVDLLYDWNHNIVTTQNVYRKSGIYPELKSPEIHNDRNISLVDAFIEEMIHHPYADEMFFKRISQTEFGCEHAGSYQVPPLVIQCFNADVLSDLEKKLLDKSMASPPYILLVNKGKCSLPMFWFDVSKLPFLSGLGPDKLCLEGDKALDFMTEARKLGLAVHPYTSRAESEFFDTSVYSTARDEVEMLYCHTGIDGMFIENVDVGVEVGLTGCDRYDPVDELIDNLILFEEGQGLDGTIAKKVCSVSSSGNFFQQVLIALSGLAMGVAICLWCLLPNYQAKQHLAVRKRMLKYGGSMTPISTNDEEGHIDENEII